MTQNSLKRMFFKRRQLLQGATGLSAALLMSKLAGCATTTDSDTTPAAGAETTSAAAGEPIKLGLIAAITGPSAVSGESITRGLTIALEKINASGGVMGGRPLELVIRDDESTPAKGVAAARELIEQEKVALVFGGLDSPVSLAMLPVFHELEVPYMGVWAAATGITRNEFDPNFAFRVSANDNIVDSYLMRYAKQELGATKVGLVLINNPWGESNQAGFEEWAPKYDLDIVGIEKFNDGDTDISPQLGRLQEGGAEALLMVANAAPSAVAMKSLLRLGWDVPVVSHWGPTGGRFPELAGEEAAARVVFMQTYSFFDAEGERSEALMSKLQEKYDVKGPEDVIAPVGTANAYDAMNLVALAIDTAESLDGPTLRDSFYDLPTYEGLIKTYEQSFSPDNHDALNEDDYILVQWKDNKLVPFQG
ncbi:ethanolamine utilization protein [Leptolyngbya sp. Heron Island J]|uniref:ABC transporter substrate-binding protein n=1 Tax=Leptolyngbya sp. Heron Island J TaxID=1385935 RepID=UPI0003B9CE5A|nr:ABC transporter substrate-binding protein [Leptolyngbya sp. Heron Island J]ESA35816.1 ethanolamine utilization protein [Leptolyngbya sp. Heron Island J]